MALFVNNMSRKFASISSFVLSSVVTLGIMCSCKDYVTTTATEKYVDNLEKFHSAYFMKGINSIKCDNLALYVDYSTCTAMGQNSPFFQALIPCWVNAAKDYYSIKGSVITKEEDNTYSLLRSINEVNFADIRTAINRMSKSDSESVLLTDGEYYMPSIAKGNVNNPYMADAFKDWLKKGHDIFFLTEPYVESNNGHNYNKKRFYIIFTDIRFAGNIYDRIIQTIDLSAFKNVDIFHLSADHPNLLAEQTTSLINPSLNASVKGFGNIEVQDWPISWKEGIEPLIVNAFDANTGEPLPNGDYITKGIKIDRNSFGGYKITGACAKVYNVNSLFSEFSDAIENNQKIGGAVELSELECDNFINVNEKEFERHGMIELHFDSQSYYPDMVLNGDPYNYTKVDICISNVEYLFNRYKDVFSFDSIDLPGEKNVSVAVSIEQCLTDPEIKNQILKCPVYSFYIRSMKR